jgi:hypothetical protein
MDAAFALAIATMLIAYLAVTGGMSSARARRLRHATLGARFENDVREMEAFFWRKGLEHGVAPDLLADISRDCRALIAAIGTRPVHQLASQAAAVERSWVMRGGFTEAARRRRFPAPRSTRGARAAR